MDKSNKELKINNEENYKEIEDIIFIREIDEDVLRQTLLEKNYNIRNLDLNNCNLTSMPKDLLKLNKLTTLNICNNRFKNFNLLIQDLSKLNNLAFIQIRIHIYKYLNHQTFLLIFL